MHAVDVAIHGRGAVASSLALALNQQGLRVAVSTPDPANAARTDVRAYALNSASRRLLQQLKVWEALPIDAVTAVHDMDVRGDSGAHLGFSSWGQCVDALPAAVWPIAKATPYARGSCDAIVEVWGITASV